MFKVLATVSKEFVQLSDILEEIRQQINEISALNTEFSMLSNSDEIKSQLIHRMKLYKVLISQCDHHIGYFNDLVSASSNSDNIIEKLKLKGLSDSLINLFNIIQKDINKSNLEIAKDEFANFKKYDFENNVYASFFNTEQSYDTPTFNALFQRLKNNCGPDEFENVLSFLSDSFQSDLQSIVSLNYIPIGVCIKSLISKFPTNLLKIEHPLDYDFGDVRGRYIIQAAYYLKGDQHNLTIFILEVLQKSFSILYQNLSTNDTLDVLNDHTLFNSHVHLFNDDVSLFLKVFFDRAAIKHSHLTKEFIACLNDDFFQYECECVIT